MPQVTANDRFILTAHPESWTVMQDSNGDSHVVPQLHPHPLRRGANGVEVSRGRLDIKKLRNTLEDSGHVVLEDFTSYLQAYDVPGGRYYCTAWESLFPGSSQIETDADGYIAWCTEQVESGTIPAPALYAIASLISRTRQRLTKVKDRAPHSARHAALAERLTKDLAALEAFHAAHSGETAPAKSGGARRSKKPKAPSAPVNDPTAPDAPPEE
jgi:hypothetical protein